MNRNRVVVLFFAVVFAALSIVIIELKIGNEALTGNNRRLADIFGIVRESTGDITEGQTDNASGEGVGISEEDDESTGETTGNDGLNEASAGNSGEKAAEDENTEVGEDSTKDGIANDNTDNDTENSAENNTNNNVDNSADKSTGEKNDEIVEIEGLVELIKLDDSFVIDIKYATTDNFTGKKIYSSARCFIHKNTAKKLIAANNEFKSLGYRIKVFDAYRPYSAQQILWDAAPDKSYIANPKKGSVHNKGAAVDITLVDEHGNELPMPSNYDEMTKRSHLNYKDCDEQLIKNRELLGSIMVKHGFKRISTEWWHFDDTDAKKYPILDIPFESFPD
ncbi:MAG TPA: D-alanyl-D-alanine dipeptidase [Clostridiaceae bacterium]|nr:D-alanyl-D-alanine dipeptidase [Clostridiaceae bacterium]